MPDITNIEHQRKIKELKDKYHVIDYDVARFFYEVINYYPEFEQAFNRDSAKIIFQMKGVGN